MNYKWFVRFCAEFVFEWFSQTIKAQATVETFDVHTDNKNWPSSIFICSTFIEIEILTEFCFLDILAKPKACTTHSSATLTFTDPNGSV